jgi:peptide/nickel transport system substrate-binding protein
MEAIYDGPIDHRNHEHQPIILEKLPSLRDGDALTRTTFVRRGARVVDAAGDVVELEDGVRVRPSGCYTDGCEVVFEGGMVKMEHLEATFTLRQDLTWSDGEPLKAGDSEFGFEVASDAATPGYRYTVERTAAYKALDDWRTRWTGLPGFRDESYRLRFFPPLPRHQLEDVPVRQLATHADARRTPLGWGPFVVEDWVPGERIELLPNPHYFRADAGLPFLERLVFHFKSDAAEVAAGVVSGVCDVGTHDEEFAGLMPFLTELAEEELFTLLAAPATGMARLSFGIRPNETYADRGFFADRRVREAIALCVDRQAMNDEVAWGLSALPGTYLPPAHPLYPEPDVKPYAYEPAAGRALLDDLGWRDADGDGVREAQGVEGIPDGEPFDVTLVAMGDSEIDETIARMLRAQLADCGVGVRVETVPQWELFAAGPEGPLFGRRFDLAQATWWLEDEVPCDRYLSSEIPQPDGWSGVNITGYANAEFDLACQAALRSLPGSSAYARHHREAQIIFSEDLPSLPLLMRLRIGLAREHVEGVTMDATSPSELWNLERVRIVDAGDED